MPQEVGTANEMVLLGPFWLFSAWLLNQLPDSESQLFVWQNPEADGVIADFAVAPEHSEGAALKPRISCEAKYTTVNVRSMLRASLNKQRTVEENRISQHVSGPHAKSDLAFHNCCVVYCPTLSEAKGEPEFVRALVDELCPGASEIELKARVVKDDAAAFAWRFSRAHAAGKTDWWVFLAWGAADAFRRLVAALVCLEREETPATACLAGAYFQHLMPDAALHLMEERVGGGKAAKLTALVKAEDRAYFKSFLASPWVTLASAYLRASLTIRRDTSARNYWARLLLAGAARDWGYALLPIPLRVGRKEGDAPIDYEAYTPWRGREARVVVLSGEAGSGKSTFLQMMHEWCLQTLLYGGAASGVPELPLFLSLQDVSGNELAGLADRLRGDEVEQVEALYVLAGFTSLGQPLERAAKGRVAPAELDLRRNGALAILKKSPICLIIDAFDQIADDEDALTSLRAIGPALRSCGARIQRVLISSRPEFRAEQALDWDQVLAPMLDDDASTSGSLPTTISLEKPPVEARSHFVNQYLRLRGLPKDGVLFTEQLARLRADGVSLTAEDILDNPLLLVIALISFVVQRLASAAWEPPAIESDLYRSLLEGLTSAARSAPIDPHRERPSEQQIIAARRLLGKLAYCHLANPRTTLGFIAPDDAVLSELNDDLGPQLVELRSSPWLARIQSEECRLERQALEDEPYLSASLDVDELRPSLYFTHPSFQEYLAAAWLGERLVDHGTLLTLRGVQLTTDGTPPSQAGVDSGKLVERLGRRGFRFFLGDLCYRARTFNSSQARTRVAWFFASLLHEYGAQQFLYDAGYLDEAQREIGQLRRELQDRDSDHARDALIVLKKWVGHLEYGKNRYQTLHELFAEIEQVPELSWYQLFIADHIQNRIPDPTLWKARFQAIAARDGFAFDEDGCLASLSATQSVPSLLRVGHYFGHLGNQVVRKRERSAALGIRDYTTAAFCRLATMEITLPSAFREIMSVAAVAEEFRRDPIFGTLRGESDPRAERFAGPTQAIGDVAQQYAGRSQAVLLRWRESRDPAELERARRDAALAQELWELALKQAGRAGGIKYYMYLADVDVKLWIAGCDGSCSRHEVEKCYEGLLQRCEKRIGFGYRLTKLSEIIAFWELVRAGATK